MNTEEALKKLAVYMDANKALNHAQMIMYVDGVTVAPKKSADTRAQTLGELYRMQYELTTDPANVEVIEYLNSINDTLEPVQAKNVAELFRNLDITRRIPKDEAVAFNILLSESDTVWHEAKEKSDFAMFEPYCCRVFDAVKRQAHYIDPDRDPYDVTLDQYERGLTKQRCDGFFSALRAKLVPLIKRVCAAEAIDTSPLDRPFPVAKQAEFSQFLMKLIGIDGDRCTLGQTEHPFTANINKNDVRITTHYYEDRFVSSMYSVIHEGGHALYELNVGDNLLGTCLDTGCSMAMHESQSRFFENYIGRSREFTSVIYPYLKKEFPEQFASVTAEELYRMVSASKPSLIRTEADELTYCMHIMIRYELEKRIFDGSLDVSDLPREWNRLYGEYLGIEVPDDKRGVLQDSHWANGNIGYFPSYAIGSAYGAQYLREMGKSFDVFGEVASGNFTRINGWLRENIWQFGMLYNPSELFARVCGEFDPAYYTDYLENKYSALYNLK